MSIQPQKNPDSPPEGRVSVTPRFTQLEEDLTFRRSIVAIGGGGVLIVLTAIAIRHTEMVTGRYISHGVPPLPAFAAVLFLSLLKPFLRKYAPRFAPIRAQILIIYVMLASATILSGSYHIRAFLPHLVSLQYNSKKDPNLAGYADYLPAWYAPKEDKLITDYYEGAKDRRVPWAAWALPLVVWSLFLVAIFVGILCLILLIQKQWIRNEKLSFPLLNLPLAMTADDWSAFGNPHTRRALFMLGFGIPLVFNGINILHVLYPMVPSIGFYIPLAPYFQNRPWEPLGSIYIFFMLEAVGIGYFVPLEISFSTWFFYLTNRFFAVAGTALGYDDPGFPYTQDQSAGGYIAVGLLLLWGLRATFKASLARSFSRSAKEPSDPMERWAWIGLVVCTLFILGFCHVAGFSLRLAIPYAMVIGIFVLVYARIRAETGVPFGFIYPYGLPKEMILNTLSVPTALSWGGTRSFVLFSSLAWLSRHHYPEEHAAYQMDAMKLSEEGRIARQKMVMALLIAFAVGLVAAYWVHLSAYYTIGCNLAGGGTGTGEYRAIVAYQEYQQMASRIANPPLRNVPKLFAMIGGFLFTALLFILRRHWLGSPFHPLGFVMATAYGDSANMWFPLMLAWMLKSLILRAGGLDYYRRGMPFFLGIAIGHFFMAGVFWPVLSLFIAPEASQSYHLYFGG